MLTGIRIAVIGGDNRQLEMIRIFSEYDASVFLYGFENWDCSDPSLVKHTLNRDPLSGMDAILLPAAGLMGEGTVETLFDELSLTLSLNHFLQLTPGKFVFTGIASELLKAWCSKAGLRLIELLNRDDVAIYNSIPTAEGAIMLAIQQTDFTIHSSTCFVLGYGRVGSTLARTLQGMGANVIVGVRRREQYARAYENGFTPFYMEELNSIVKNADLIFNTIPAMVLPADTIVLLKKTVFIIDLASKPGGTDFRFADKRGIKAILALGLPGKVASKTAGQILAHAIINKLHTSLSNGGE